jgi:hypothetical protein
MPAQSTMAALRRARAASSASARYGAGDGHGGARKPCHGTALSSGLLRTTARQTTGRQQLDRADGAGDSVAPAPVIVSDGDGEPEAAGPRGEADQVAGAVAVTAVPGADVPGAADVAASAGAESDRGVVPPYIQVPVDCTVPWLSVIPETVTWCPSVSVSRTVNGPGPAPEEAIQ